MKNKLTLLFILSCSIIYAQGVSLNKTGAIADPSAMLDVSASDMGVLIPRIALTDTLDDVTITLPAPSLIVYNTGLTGGLVEGYYYNKGTAATPYWVELLTNPLSHDINMAGNKIVNLATCTDDHDAVNKAYVDALVAGGGGGGGGSTWITSGATELSLLSLTPLTFLQAAYYCDTLSEGGHTDWYLPSAQEVMYLVSTSFSTLTQMSENKDFWTNTFDNYWGGDLITFNFGCPCGDNNWWGQANIYARCGRQ